MKLTKMADFFPAKMSQALVRDARNPMRVAKPERECNHPPECRSAYRWHDHRICLKCMCLVYDPPQNDEDPPKRASEVNLLVMD